MQCKDVEFAVEQEGLAPLPEAARAHVATCSYCQGFVADLANIVSIAHEFPAEVEPPARVWASLPAQLELAGIIKTPAVPASGERELSADSQDDLAGECLSYAYQQKAELLSAMMDREGSLH